MNDEDLMKVAYEALDTPNITTAPKMVPERTLHADADIFSYKACDLEYTYAENVMNLKELITAWKVLAGAEFIVLHLTLGTKGGRENIARVKKYQGNRSKTDQDKANRVLDLRLFMAEYVSRNCWAINNYEQEADDSLCQAMYQETDHEKVLFSPDKDLWMVPGMHLNKDTFELEMFPKGYGKTALTLDKHGKQKLMGRGTSWFWHQMLMGDAADNIPGLPYLDSALVIEYCPPTALVNLQRKIATGRMPTNKLMTTNQKRNTQIKYTELCATQKAKKIGQVLAARYLSNCRTDKSAHHWVLQAYKGWYAGNSNIFTWDGVRMDCTPYDMFLEQARLLWMRRRVNEDVEDWFKEILDD